MELTGSMRRLFRAAGRRGGMTRARRLSSSRRSEIASAAAGARWGGAKPAERQPVSVRLGEPSWDDPVYLEEVLSEGTVEEWGQVYRRVWDRPFGPTAAALDRVLSRVRMYGVTPLWRGLLRGARGNGA